MELIAPVIDIVDSAEISQKSICAAAVHNRKDPDIPKSGRLGAFCGGLNLFETSVEPP